MKGSHAGFAAYLRLIKNIQKEEPGLGTGIVVPVLSWATGDGSRGTKTNNGRAFPPNPRRFLLCILFWFCFRRPLRQPCHSDGAGVFT